MFTRLLILVFCLGFSATAWAQEKDASARINELVESGQTDLAAQELQQRLDLFFSSALMDSAVEYISLAGRVELRRNGPRAAVARVTRLVNRIRNVTAKPSTLRQAYIEAADFYSRAGDHQLAYSTSEKAYRQASSEPGDNRKILGLIESNTGAYAQRMGNISLSGTHHRKAFSIIRSISPVDYERLYLSANSMGGIMWYASKMDSALYYYEIALDALSRLDTTPLNRHYRPAILLNNMSAISSIQGQITEGIDMMKRVVTHLRDFLDGPATHQKKADGNEFLCQAIDNLGGMYKSLGDYKQARDLLEYSYAEKQKQFDRSSPEIFKSLVVLGQLYREIRENDKATRFLQEAITLIDSSGGDDLWRGDACYSMALAYDQMKEPTTAAGFFEQAFELYERSFQGEYDETYLDFLRNAALFYAENGEHGRGITLGQKGYAYVSKTQGNRSLAAAHQLLNLAEIYEHAGNPASALRYSEEGLQIVDQHIRETGNLLDSVKVEIKKPRAILIKARAEYSLLTEKAEPQLRSLLAALDEALAILERKKTIMTDASSINLLMADHAELMEFVKKITLELYEATHNEAYLNRLITVHESALYSRIRSRLDKNDSLQFLKVPAKIRSDERAIKEAISSAFDNPGNGPAIERYFQAVRRWNDFQADIRERYPAYYFMRYASIFRSLDSIQHSLPENTTVVRYLFIGEQLYAFVADRHKKNIYSLDAKDLSERLSTFSKDIMDPHRAGELLYGLYRQLWLPIEAEIDHRRLIIVPDGVLHQLSFELLTPVKTDSFQELAAQCLLASHSISYQYSLILLSPPPVKKDYPDNFVGFAPGFFSRSPLTKQGAGLLPGDKTYMTLLPLPFTAELMTKAKQLFGGNLFLNAQSTEASFKEHAGNHTIIHIGTHAESDNINPEFSRLIFSGDDHSEEDNSLFLYEIYNCDLSSRLAVLTACESGKPGYKDGEGMVSLAHAFNYAGSESMLTGLWKIDEQSSAEIANRFYHYLLKGLSKDDALRQAKLDYLSKAQGRMLSPAYWGGLVLMGDISPVEFRSARGWTWITLGAILLILVSAWIIVRMRRTDLLPPPGGPSSPG